MEGPWTSERIISFYVAEKKNILGPWPMRWCGDCVNCWERSSNLHVQFTHFSHSHILSPHLWLGWSLLDVQRLRWTPSCVVGCANTSVASGAHSRSLAHIGHHRYQSYPKSEFISYYYYAYGERSFEIIRDETTH